MTVYIALLRGINVGGHKKIKMSDLKQMLEAMGLLHVQTYIQSGNVLFHSEEPPAPLQKRIEQQIAAVFGMQVTVMLRTADQLKAILQQCPYDPDTLSEGESIHIYVLTERPKPELLDFLKHAERDKDEYDVGDLEMYVYFRQSILDSKLTKHLQKLGATVTARNWNTMNKLSALAEAMHAEQ